MFKQTFLTNTHIQFIMERALARPTILGLTILEPILTILSISALLSILTRVSYRNFLSRFDARLTNRFNNPAVRPAEGFTIIEVLIVLAIAGLIMLIVFLAVPALQRNSRNTQRRNDVARYAAAVNEWKNSNSAGNIPAAAADLTTAGTGVNALANVGFLTAPTTVTAAAATVTNNATVSTFLYVPGTICSGSNATNTGASSRQFTLLWASENSTGAAAPQCQAG